jgi:hypothetical protein
MKKRAELLEREKSRKKSEREREKRDEKKTRHTTHTREKTRRVKNERRKKKGHVASTQFSAFLVFGVNFLRAGRVKKSSQMKRVS